MIGPGKIGPTKVEPAEFEPFEIEPAEDWFVSCEKGDTMDNEHSDLRQHRKSYLIVNKNFMAEWIIFSMFALVQSIWEGLDA